MIGFCEMDTQECKKSREECEHWAKCIFLEIEEGNETGFLKRYKDRITELEGDREKLASRLNSAEAQIISYDEMAAQFREKYDNLEKALCEAEARSLLNFQRFEAAMDEARAEGDLVWARTHDWDACHEDEQKDRIAFARRVLKAEGKL